MVNAKEWLEIGQKFHGHKCPAMPNGLRVAEAMMQTKKISFFKDYREKGVPPTQVPDNVVQPLVDKVMNEPAEMTMVISDVFEYNWKKPKHSYNSLVCEVCGEMVIEEYTELKEGKKVCKDCI